MYVHICVFVEKEYIKKNYKYSSKILNFEICFDFRYLDECKKSIHYEYFSVINYNLKQNCFYYILESYQFIFM